MEASKELIKLIGYMDASQQEQVLNFLKVLSSNPNKGKLMNLAYNHDLFNIDSALPQDLINQHQGEGTPIDTYFNVISYKVEDRNKGIYLVNLAEKIVSNLLETLNK